MNTSEIQTFWQKFINSLTNKPIDNTYDVWDFGQDKKLAKKLYELVLTKKKTATTGLYEENETIPKIGSKGIILNEENHPFCIIEYIDVEVLTFKKVSWDYAKLEGEDKTFEQWKSNHQTIFKIWSQELNKEFTGETLVICSTFKVIFT